MNIIVVVLFYLLDIFLTGLEFYTAFGQLVEILRIRPKAKRKTAVKIVIACLALAGIYELNSENWNKLVAALHVTEISKYKLTINWQVISLMIKRLFLIGLVVLILLVAINYVYFHYHTDDSGGGFNTDFLRQKGLLKRQKKRGRK